MKKELKEKIVACAEESVSFEEVNDILLFPPAPVVKVAPDAYWVQAWIKVPLDAVKIS